MASGQAQNAFTFAPDFQRGMDAASRIVQFLNMKPKITDPEVPAVTEFVRPLYLFLSLLSTKANASVKSVCRCGGALLAAQG